MMVNGIFGEAGDRVIIEERLHGKELSLLAFCDGKTVVPMTPACDYKPIGDNNQGPNTGGMGGYSPSSVCEMSLLIARKGILERIVKALANEGSPYKGVLYAGLMDTNEGIKALEFNARFGDPETQVILPRLETDLVDIMLAVINGTLDKVQIKWSNDVCVGVVMASEGYPGHPKTGFPITGLGNLNCMIRVTNSHSRKSILQSFNHPQITIL